MSKSEPNTESQYEDKKKEDDEESVSCGITNELLNLINQSIPFFEFRLAAIYYGVHNESLHISIE